MMKWVDRQIKPNILNLLMCVVAIQCTIMIAQFSQILTELENQTRNLGSLSSCGDEYFPCFVRTKEFDKLNVSIEDSVAVDVNEWSIFEPISVDIANHTVDVDIQNWP